MDRKEKREMKRGERRERREEEKGEERKVKGGGRWRGDEERGEEGEEREDREEMKRRRRREIFLMRVHNMGCFPKLSHRQYFQQRNTKFMI